MRVLGLDIGGAKLKAAIPQQSAVSVDFPLWKSKQQLTTALSHLIQQFPVPDRVAVTMTGELADCFATKQEGVHYIVDSVCRATKTLLKIYLLDGRLVSPDEAKKHSALAAASNWHALARYAARHSTTEHAVLVDIGSTTTDVIPLSSGQVVADGRTDFQRLLNHELIYTGVERSPIVGLARVLNHRGRACPLMNELFATTLDAYTVLGKLDESGSSEGTADGRDRSIASCIARLARLFGKDSSDFDKRDATEAARQVQQIQIAQIGEAILKAACRHSDPHVTLLTAGQGEFLIDELASPEHEKINSFGGQESPVAGRLNLRRQSLRELAGESVSQCATAWAVAVLAEEEALNKYCSAKC